MDVVFGILSYRNDSPDNASGNIGDSIQTLAALNCYRRALRMDMPFSEFLDRVLTDSVPGARFVFVNRDSSHRQSLPPRVITLMNGWFMHPGRNGQLEWPMHESVEPIFVSFHLADERMLTPAGVEYLKRFEPIGCRDAATVNALMAKGIAAYFTGCLTLTIDFLPWTGGSPDELFVDVVREGRKAIRHWDPLLKNRDPKTMLRRAYSLLKQYSMAAKVTTSRLHCFLPCIAMGVPVTLTDVDLGDPRLRGVDTWDYSEIRQRLARDVADRLARTLPPARSRQVPVYDVCFAFDDSMAAYLPVVAHSILRNNRHARIRFHLVHLEGMVAPPIEGAEVISYPARWDRPYSGLAHVSHATMLRLLIPELIHDDLRLLYLDIDVVVNTNLEPIFAVDPGPTGIAMRTSLVTGDKLKAFTGATGKSLPDYVWSRSGNAGVALMDLATLRRNGFTRFCLDYPEVVNDQLLINLYCHGEYAELSREWNVFNSQDSQVLADTDRYILHYTGPAKPWSQQKPEHWQVWNWYSRRAREQAHTSPAGMPSDQSNRNRNRKRVCSPCGFDLIRDIRSRNLTHLSHAKLLGLAETCERIEDAGLPGLFLEAGCALGGSAILIASLKSTDREFRVYDVFGMIPPPTADDTPDVHDRYKTIAEGKARGIGDDDLYYGYVENLYDVVMENMLMFGIDPQVAKITLTKGLVQDTLNVREDVAFAHVDVDWHDSVKTCLERIFPRLVPGGSILVDDYHFWGGCRKATDAFLKTVRGGFRADGSAGSLRITKT
jgi:asparagine synthase (glutamine-hydrolysing)